MPQPEQVAALTDRLQAVYADLWQRLTDEEQALLEQWPTLPRRIRLARLRELQDLVDRLASTAEQQALRFVVEELPSAILLGAATGGAADLTGVDLDAVAVLARDTYDDLLAATTGVRRSGRTLVRALAKQRVADAIVSGDTAVQAGRALRRDLASRGLTAVTYSDGSRHGLAEYAAMVVRTKTAQAYNTGNLGAIEKAGTGWTEALDGPECGLRFHEDEEKANGRVYPTDVAFEFLVAHPNCTRAWAPRPDVKTAAEAAAASPSQSEAQIADQRLVEDERAQAVARRAAAKALDHRVGTRAAQLVDDPNSRVTSPANARRVAARQVRADRDRRAATRAARLRTT